MDFEEISGSDDAAVFSLNRTDRPMMVSELEKACRMIRKKHGDVPVVFYRSIDGDAELIPIRAAMGFLLDGQADQPMALLANCQIVDDPEEEDIE